MRIEARAPLGGERKTITALFADIQGSVALLQELDPDAATVVVCHHGVRSFQVALFLERNGFASVYNLSGGVAAWAECVDPSMPRY